MIFPPVKWIVGLPEWKGMIEMFSAACGAVIVCMVLALIRAFMGPTLYDRVLAANTFGTKTVLLLAVIGFLTGRPDFLDLSLVYVLINFIGTIAILKFVEFGIIGSNEEEARA